MTDDGGGEFPDSGSDRQHRTLTVRGTGLASGPPDSMHLVFGVNVADTSPGAAWGQMIGKSELLMTTIRSAGVPDTDIRTAALSVYLDQTHAFPPGVLEARHVAANSVAVTVPIASAGPLIDSAAAAVGDGFTLQSGGATVRDSSGLYASAREDAIRNAKAQAEQMATALGVRLGQVLSATDESGWPVVRMQSGPGPIEAGLQAVTATVRVTFKLD